MSKKRKHSNVYSLIMILLGIIIIVIWLPFWIWLVFLGLILIISGINIYYR